MVKYTLRWENGKCTWLCLGVKVRMQAAYVSTSGFSFVVAWYETAVNCECRSEQQRVARANLFDRVKLNTV